MSSALSVSRLVSNRSNLHYHDNRKDHYYIKSQSLKEQIQKIKDAMKDDCKNEETNDCNDHYNAQIKTLEEKLNKSNQKLDIHIAKYKKIYQVLANQGRSASRRGGKTKKQRKHKKGKTAKKR